MPQTPDAPDNPFSVLLRHNGWANRALLERCRTIPRDDFHRRFDIGPGSLHDTLTHICASTHRWNLLLAGTPSAVRLEDDPPRTPEALLALHDEIDAALVRQAGAAPLGERVSGVRRGEPYTSTRAAVLSHVLYHSTHHRAQCLNMQRRLGHASLPDVSVLTCVLTPGTTPT